jgi:hypothetical protein
MSGKHGTRPVTGNVSNENSNKSVSVGLIVQMNEIDFNYTSQTCHVRGQIRHTLVPNSLHIIPFYVQANTHANETAMRV